MRTLQFQRVVGSGAFGTVYLADMAGQRGFRRQVAVKVLLGGHPDGELFVSRVRDEARLLGLLQDDHILKVLELVRVNDRDAVVMEYVEGVDLAAIVESGSQPPPRALGELGAAIAGALHRAHTAIHPGTGEALNVIHRDVKPANVMITDRGGVKLLDFGVARAKFAARESFTGQFVLGTLNYMAPEYIVTGEVSFSADIYGLALTLWEAACGEVFGQPKLRKDLHEKRVEERLTRISASHAELVPILRRMLAWDPVDRPDGEEAERALIAATDMLRGTGLRSWAGESVQKVLAKERAAAKDTCGLLGQTVTIDDEVPVAPLAAAPPSPPPEATQMHVERPSFLNDARPPAAPPPAPPAASPPGAAPPAPPRTLATASPPIGPPRTKQAPRRAAPSNGSLVLQGLLVGGVLGVFVVGFFAVLILWKQFH